MTHFLMLGQNMFVQDRLRMADMVAHCTLDVPWLPMHIQMLVQSIFCEEALVTDMTAEISVSMSHEMHGKILSLDS